MFEILNTSRQIFSRSIVARQTYYDRLNFLLNTEQVVVVQGQRRVWKSFIILGYLISKKINLDKVFFVNKELDINDEVMNAKDLNKVYKSFIEENGEPEYIVIDEIQDIQEWEKFIRAMYALKKYKIIISWSNSQLLGGELATYLSWRYLTLEVFPLGYDEYLYFTKKPDIIDTYMEYQRWGWLPELVGFDDEDSKSTYLEWVLNTIFIRDVVGRYNIKDVGYLQKVLHYIADIIGSEMSIRNIHNASKEYGRWDDWSLVKLSNYLNMLQTPYLIHKVSRFDIAGKKILEHNEKYYFNDIGVRNSIKRRVDIDKWKILENVVFLHLKRIWYKVYVGNYSNKEIDFVAQKSDKLMYVQVAWVIDNEKTSEREYGNLLSIKDAFPKYVVTTDLSEPATREWVIHMNIMKFIQEIQS